MDNETDVASVTFNLDFIHLAHRGFLHPGIDAEILRIMVGTLLEAGCGRITAEQIRAALENPERQKAGPTGPNDCCHTFCPSIRHFVNHRADHIYGTLCFIIHARLYIAASHDIHADT